MRSTRCCGSATAERLRTLGGRRTIRLRNEFAEAFLSFELRASLAQKLLHDFAFGLVHDRAPDLSLRQLAVLLTVYLESPPHTVRGLAAKLKVTKPVITRALDSMGRHELLTRRRDPADRRNVIVQRTLEGALYVERLGDLIAAKARDLPR